MQALCQQAAPCMQPACTHVQACVCQVMERLWPEDHACGGCAGRGCPHAACAGHGKSCAPSFAAQPKWTRPKPHFSRSDFGSSRIWLKPFWLKSLGSTLNSSPRPLGATPPPHGTLADRRLEPAQLGRARRSPGSADPGPTAPHLPGGVGPGDHNLRKRRANLLPRGPGVPGVRP